MEDEEGSKESDGGRVNFIACSSPSSTNEGDNVTLTRRRLSVPWDAGTTKPAGQILALRGSSTVDFGELEERRGEEGVGDAVEVVDAGETT